MTESIMGGVSDVILRFLLATSLALIAGVNFVPAKAQTPTGMARTVYLLEVQPKSEEPSDEIIELNAFAEKMVELRLASLKSFAVVAQKDTPACFGEPNFKGHSIFYVFKTSIDGSGSGDTTAGNQRNAEMILDYELLKYTGCQITSLVHRSEAFKTQTTLSSLITMTDVMALLLEEERNSNRSILNVAAAKGMPGVQPIKDKTVDHLVSRLTQLDEFQTVDLRTKPQSQGPDPAADFTITPQFVPRQNETMFYYTVALRNGRSFRSGAENVPKDGSREQLEKFYEDAATLGISFVQELKNALAVGLSGPISNEQAAAMEKRALELMCFQQDQKSCNYQPELAVPLLAELTEKKKASNSKVAYKLLADAYLNLDEHADAASALDQTISLSAQDSVDTRLNLLRQSANSWYESKHYIEAAARADAFIRLAERSNPTIDLGDMILRSSKSYHFSGEHSKALDNLLAGVRRFSKVGRYEGTQIRQLSESIIPYLHGKELETAVAQLKQSAEKESFWWPLKAAWFTAENQLARERLVTAEAALARGDFDDVDSLLAANESIPSQNLGYATRGEILRLRALWYRDVKGDSANALQLLTKASQLDISDQGTRTRIRLQDAETRIFNKDYEAATELLAQLVGPDPEIAGYAAVRLFYQFWANLALNKEATANDLEVQLSNSIKQLQKNAQPVPWDFTAAAKFLNGVTLAPDRKQRLYKMIDTMSSGMRKRPITPSSN